MLNQIINHTYEIMISVSCRPEEMTTTVWLKKVLCGTELKALQEGIPEAIPSEMCYLGWQESLVKLIKLVEPEIPNA